MSKIKDIAATCKELSNSCRVLNQVNVIINPEGTPPSTSSFKSGLKKRVFSLMIEDALLTANLEISHGTPQEVTHTCMELQKAVAHLHQAETICLEAALFGNVEDVPDGIKKRRRLVSEMFSTVVEKAGFEIEQTKNAAQSKEKK